MATFQYKILDNDGRISRGQAVLPFDDVAPAIRYLERQGGVVLSIRPLDAVSATLVNFRNSLRKVKRKELAELLNNMSMLLTAGVPVLSAVNELLGDLKNRSLVMVLRFIRTDIENGRTLSQAMERHPNIFSSLILSMCRVGEETGRLDKMLLQSSEHLLHMDEIISSTKRAMLYPSFLFFVVVGSAAFWFLVVVPQLVGLFMEMGVELPFVTLMLIAISDFMQRFFLFIAGGVTAAVVALVFLRKHVRGVRYALDALLLRLPVLSTVIETSLVARICEYLGILISAGVGVMRTLDIIIATLDNLVYQDRFKKVQDGVRNGLTISDAMRQAKAMHPFAIRMLSVGEQTGKIDEQTLYVARVYRERLAGLVEVLGKSLEPVMLIFLGLMFAVIIIGLLLPIYDLVANISG